LQNILQNIKLKELGRNIEIICTDSKAYIMKNNWLLGEILNELWENIINRQS